MDERIKKELSSFIGKRIAEMETDDWTITIKFDDGEVLNIEWMEGGGFKINDVW